MKPNKFIDFAKKPLSNNKYITLDGVNDSIFINYVDGSPFPGYLRAIEQDKFTVEYRVRNWNCTTIRYLFWLGSYIRFGFNGNGNAYLWLRTNAGIYPPDWLETIETRTIALPVGYDKTVWNYFRWQIDFTTRNLKFYFNSTLVLDVAIVGIHALWDWMALTIGSGINNSFVANNFLPVQIDFVRMYSRLITDAEATNNLAGNLALDRTGLVHEFLFNDDYRNTGNFAKHGLAKGITGNPFTLK